MSTVLLAVYYGQTRIANLLVERGARPDLFEAATIGQLDTVKHILTRQPELVNAYAPDGFFSLALAAFFGQAGVVAYLLDLGAEVHQTATNAQRVNTSNAASANILAFAEC